MRSFFNPELRAPNVLTATFDQKVLEPLLPLLTTEDLSQEYFESSPGWHGDIRWVAPNTIEKFKLFHRVFRALAISDLVRPYLDVDKDVAVYGAFLVVRSETREANWHADWYGTDNEAFTLITPLTIAGTSTGILYQDVTGADLEYQYKMGEAIIFGDHFLHTTKPGRSDEPVVLLSYTFGSDKMEHWPKIVAASGYQTNLMRLPDGTFRVGDFDDADGTRRAIAPIGLRGAPRLSV